MIRGDRVHSEIHCGGDVKSRCDETVDINEPYIRSASTEETMCQRAVCGSCRKATYEGCGRHVEQVLDGVPTLQRCSCEPAARTSARTQEPAPPTRPAQVRPDTKDGRWAQLIAWMKSPA
ncbi:hypothetical protein E5082_24565 [Streptomyces griseoluteus]|uniref:Uncharacterized protein n=1 Tax=Streptomyces griseoluteus TaxID=29306 RepID=A0A4Z1D892_STRGP|nr:hypothetical protein E5082_24565 [Streptomyces griseoluteus]